MFTAVHTQLTGLHTAQGCTQLRFVQALLCGFPGISHTACCCAQALLQHSEAVFDFPRLVNSLAQALSDHQRVITAAIEALAVVHHLIGDQIQGLLIAAGVSISSRLMLSARFASNQLPALKRDATSEAEVRLGLPPSVFSPLARPRSYDLEQAVHGCTLRLMHLCEAAHGSCSRAWVLSCGCGQEGRGFGEPQYLIGAVAGGVPGSA